MNEETNETITTDFLNNDNPFIFSNDTYTPNPKLEVIQALQPSFIPYALNQEELKSNFRRYLDANRSKMINDIINEYCYKNQIPFTSEEALLMMNNYDNDDLMDALIKIKYIKLWHKQDELREKVLKGFISTMTPEDIFNAYNYKIPKETEDKKIIEKIKQKLN